MKRIAVIVLAVVVLAAAAWAAVGYLGVQAVTTEAAVGREVVRTVSATGHFRAAEEKKPVARHTMAIEEIGAEEGETVGAGEIFIRGDASDLEVKMRALEAERDALAVQIRAGRVGLDAREESARSAVAAAREELEKARADAESAEELYEEGAVAKTQWEKARLAVAVAESRLRGAEAQLAEVTRCGEELSAKQEQMEVLSRRLRALAERIDQYGTAAPQDMTLADLYVEEGDVVSAGTPLALLQGDRLEVGVNLLARDAREVKVGQEAILSGDALGAGRYPAEVSRVHPHAVQMVSDLGVKQRRVPVEITPAEAPEGVLPGYPTDVEIIVAGEVGLAVNRDAAFSIDGCDAVFRLSDGRALVTEVEVGLRGDDFIIIDEGLSENDEVIINPPEDLRDGSRVRPE